MEASHNEELNSMMRSVSKNIGVYDLTPEPLHSGTNGQVFHITNRMDRKAHVLKVIWKHNNQGKAEKKKVAEKLYSHEKKMHQSMKNRYVLTLYNSFQDESNYYFILQFCEKGDLKPCIKQGMKMASIKQLSLQIAKGLSYIHKSKIIHGDMKPDNILLTSDSQIKLCDFGSAAKCKQGEKVKGYTGCIRYAPPEAIQYHDEKVDIWAFGCILYEMATGRVPFEHSSWKELTTLINQEYLRKYKYDPRLSSELIHLLKRIFVYDSSRRIKMQEIIAHPFYTNEPLPEEMKEERPKQEINQTKSLKNIRKSCEMRQANKQNTNYINLANNHYQTLYNANIIESKMTLPLKDAKRQKDIRQSVQLKGKVQGKMADTRIQNRLNYNIKNGTFQQSKRVLSPLNTNNMVIKPLKMKKKIIRIDKQGLTMENEGEDEIWLNISCDGKTIRIKKHQKEKIFSSLQLLPQKYYKYYEECKRVVKNIQNQTPRQSYTDDEIEMNIMFNGTINVIIQHKSIEGLTPEDLLANRKNLSKGHYDKIRAVYSGLLMLTSH